MFKKILLFSLIFILYGCKNEMTNQTDEQPTQIKNELVNDTLILSMAIPKTFNPLQNNDESVDKILRLAFEPLIKFDEARYPVNNLVEQIIFDENYNATVKLREDIFWSDGTNLDADDVIFSIEQIKLFESLYKLDDIISYKKKSPHELDIKFKDSGYVSIYNLNFPVIPKKIFENEISNPAQIITNGPYKFSSYSRMKDLTLEKNEKYFGIAPEFKNINVLIIPDKETNMSAFNQKIIDVIFTDSNEIRKFRNDSDKIFYTTNNLEFIFFNPTNNLFNIKPLHNMILNILPLDKIKTEIYGGMLANSIFKTEIEKVNIEQAKEIISEYVGSANLKILVNAENSQRVKTAELIKKTLADYGINSFVDKKNFDEYKIAIQNKNFDLLIGGFYPEKLFDYEILFNLLDYHLKNFSQLKFALDEQEFNSEIKNLNNQMSQDAKIIILGQKKEILLTNKKIRFEESLYNFLCN